NIRGCGKPLGLDPRLQPLRWNMANVALTRVELIYFSLIDIVSQNAETSVYEYVDERHAYVSKAEYRDDCLPFVDAIHQRLKLGIIRRHARPLIRIRLSGCT